MTVSGNLQSFSAPSELVAYLLDPDTRLQYVVRQLEKCAACTNDGLPNRVVNVASRLICGTNWLNHVLRHIVLNGSYRWIDPMEHMKPIRLDLIGYVYFTESPLRPSNIKIGFTTRIPEVRVRTLMANSGEKLTLTGSFVGTLMDEQILHCINEKRHVVGEWYTNPIGLPPDALTPPSIADQIIHPDVAMENARHDH